MPVQHRGQCSCPINSLAPDQSVTWVRLPERAPLVTFCFGGEDREIRQRMGCMILLKRCAVAVIGAVIIGVIFSLRADAAIGQTSYQTLKDFTFVGNINKPVEEVFIPAPEVEMPPEPQLNSLGVYRISAYCPCRRCCLKTDGITASGAKATPNRTVAVDGLPFGTRLLIDGIEYVVEDRVGSGKRLIDVFFNTHEEALNSGYWYDTEVFEIL